MHIGDRIRKKRKENNLTQKELGDLVNVSAQVISNWERGYTHPNHDDVSRLSEALNCSTEYLHGKNNINNALSDKDERDIAKRMKKLKEDLTSAEGLSFHGEPLSEEAVESLLEAIEYAERQTTRINKKYIPKKYRKDNK